MTLSICENISKPPLKVSVAVITYNQEDIIVDTIESILTAPRYENLEIVVADDCSTDNTRDVLLKLHSAYPDIIKLVFNEKNLGITGNSNAAFFGTTGDLVAIMGGDDLFLPGKIAAQVAEFERDPTLALSYHAVEIFEESTGKTLAITDQNPSLEKKDVYDIISKCGIAGASSIMVRRSACPAYGFDMRLPTVSDWKFSIDVAYGRKVKKLNGVYGKYRKSGSGASERTYELLDESLRALELIQDEYPGDRQLKIACDKGSARYIAGEAYRSIFSYPERSELLARRAFSFRKTPFYGSVWLVAALTAKIPPLRALVGYIGGFASHRLK